MPSLTIMPRWTLTLDAQRLKALSTPRPCKHRAAVTMRALTRAELREEHRQVLNAVLCSVFTQDTTEARILNLLSARNLMSSSQLLNASLASRFVSEHSA